MSEGSIRKFIEMHQQQLEGLVLTGMGHVTDMLFITCLPKTKVRKSNINPDLFS